LHAQAHISADETTIQCLKEPGRRAQSKSYLWVYKSRSGHEHPVVIFAPSLLDTSFPIHCHLGRTGRPALGGAAALPRRCSNCKLVLPL
jgi:hypothetical protein